MRHTSPLTDSSRGHFLVATGEGVVYSQVVGLGNMNNCVSFKEFTDHLRSQGYRRYVFDFSRCDGFDSTFMGILLSIALSDSSVVAINMSDQQRNLLGEVGLNRVVRICEDPIELPRLTLQKVGVKPVDQHLRLRTILMAHENLVRLEPANQKKFATFLELLRRELGEGSSL